MVITVYVLKSLKDQRFYVGMTNNVIRRFKQHQSGSVKSTKSRKPFVIVYSKEFPSLGIAREHEKYLKTAAGKRFLKKNLRLQQPSSISTERNKRSAVTFVVGMRIPRTK